MQYAEMAMETRKTCKGVKGYSILPNIPNFDIIRSLDLDSFHALVNVAKRFTWLWFDSKFSKKSYNIANRLSEVNSRLLGITPTSDVSRFPRSLEERSDYRGHEWYYWIVIYSVPCLKNILPARYLNHWCLLVHGIALLMQNSVSKSEVAYADRYLNQFVSDVDNLYGIEHVTFSIHLLVHFKRSTDDYGQPWTHSAYVYESFNAEIKNSVKSSNNAASQICKGIQLKSAISKLHFHVKYAMQDREKLYFDKVNKTQRATEPHCVIGQAALLGKPVLSSLPPNAALALKRAGILFNEKDCFPIYERCELFNEVFQSCEYSKVTKQNNSVALLEDNKIFIVSFFVVVSNRCYILGNFVEYDSRFKLCDRLLPHFRILKENCEGMLRCIPVDKIQEKLLSFSIQVSASEYVRFACINVLKMEMLS